MLEVAKSAPDGHTLILGHVGSMAVNPYIFSNPGYDVNRDFAPVTLLAKVPSLFVVHPDLPVKTLKELVAYTKNNPGKLNYGSAGNASAGHLAMEYLKLATGMEILHIPYKGTGPALTDLLANRIQVFSAGTPALLQYIRTGKLRAIATGTPQRLPSLPQLPTVAESGYKGFESVQWYGIMAPAQTPEFIIKKLQEETYKALHSPAIAERFASEDAVIGGGPSSDFAALIAQQQVVWKEVVAKAQIKVD
jgi:tripartite-type tricarboxylate transporter receptor subunit TctC